MFRLSKMWIYGLAAGGLIVALLFGIRAVYNAGYEARDVAAQRDAAIASKAAETAETELKDELAELKRAHAEEREHAAKEVDSLRTRIASGAVRLRIPVAPTRVAGRPAPPPGEARTESGPTAAASPPPESERLEPAVTAEIEPSTALELLSIAADGDAAIRDLNECIDAYAVLRKKLDELRKNHGPD